MLKYSSGQVYENWGKSVKVFQLLVGPTTIVRRDVVAIGIPIIECRIMQAREVCIDFFSATGARPLEPETFTWVAICAELVAAAIVYSVLGPRFVQLNFMSAPKIVSRRISEQEIYGKGLCAIVCWFSKSESASRFEFSRPFLEEIWNEVKDRTVTSEEYRHLWSTAMPNVILAIERSISTKDVLLSAN